MNLKEFSTKELTDELKEREGVNTIIAEPYALTRGGNWSIVKQRK